MYIYTHIYLYLRLGSDCKHTFLKALTANTQ